MLLANPLHILWLLYQWAIFLQFQVHPTMYLVNIQPVCIMIYHLFCWGEQNVSQDLSRWYEMLRWDACKLFWDCGSDLILEIWSSIRPLLEHNGLTRLVEWVTLCWALPPQGQGLSHWIQHVKPISWVPLVVSKALSGACYQNKGLTQGRAEHDPSFGSALP